MSYLCRVVVSSIKLREIEDKFVTSQREGTKYTVNLKDRTNNIKRKSFQGNLEKNERRRTNKFVSLRNNLSNEGRQERMKERKEQEKLEGKIKEENRNMKHGKKM